MNRVGIICGAFRPIHDGHVELIKRASRECNDVQLFMSTSDRRRGGEAVILGDDMYFIFKTQLEHILPSNVHITYGGSPVSNAWELLGKADKAENINKETEYVVYGDPIDVEEAFSQKALEKYVPTLWKMNLVRTVSVSRTSTIKVSGTDMRKWLATGDKEKFCSHVPTGMDASTIWDILKRTADIELAKKNAKKKR